MENLTALNISSVSLYGRITLEDDGRDKLSGILGKHNINWPRQGVDKLGLYESGEVRQHIGLEITGARSGGSQAAVFNLDAYPFPGNERLRAPTRNKQLRQFSEIHAILSDLAAAELTARVHSHLAWRFPPDSRKSIITLPMVTLQGPEVPLTEVVGVRLSRTSAEGITSVTIDLGNDRSMFVILVLPPVSAELSGEILDGTVQKGCRVIEEFVFETTASAEGTLS